MTNVAVPQIYGVSELQRKTKKVISSVKLSENPVYLTEHNKISVVMITPEKYEALQKDSEILQERKDWEILSESSLKFWEHPSNDIYNEML